MQQMKIWLVMLFLSRKKFHAKQIFVLSSFMKCDPGLVHYSEKKIPAQLSCNKLSAGSSMFYSPNLKV